MKLYKSINKSLIKKITIVTIVCFILSGGFVFAKYFDKEISRNNFVGASSLDIEVENEDDELQPVEMAAFMLSGDEVTRESEILNVGKSDVKYKINFEKTDGSDTLCNALQLKAKKGNSVKYEGDLDEFDYDDGTLDEEEDDEWKFIITAPHNIVSGKICEFDFLVIAWQDNFKKPTQGWVDEEIISNNSIQTGVETPVQTGYNENDEDYDDSYDEPRNPNELACIDEMTNINGISVHWNDVSNGNDKVKYQRQYNKVDVYDWTGSEIYDEAYTNYRTFGGESGKEGIYGSRVRAWIDSNNDDNIDENEIVSDWSNECYIEFDETAPKKIDNVRTFDFDCKEIFKKKFIKIKWDESSKKHAHHYDIRMSGNNNIVHSDVPQHIENIKNIVDKYKYQVRAVDRAGNNGEWSEWCDVALSCEGALKKN